MRSGENTSSNPSRMPKSTVLDKPLWYNALRVRHTGWVSTERGDHSGCAKRVKPQSNEPPHRSVMLIQRHPYSDTSLHVGLILLRKSIWVTLIWVATPLCRRNAEVKTRVTARKILFYHVCYLISMGLWASSSS